MTDECRVVSEHGRSLLCYGEFLRSHFRMRLAGIEARPETGPLIKHSEGDPLRKDVNAAVALGGMMKVDF